MSFMLHASYLEKCHFEAKCKGCEEDICSVELLSMVVQPGSHGDFHCKDIMKEPNQSIAINGEKPYEVKCGLQFSYYSGRGPDGVVESKAWKVIKLKSLK